MMSSNFQWYIKKQWGLSEEDTLKLQNFYEKRSLEKGEVLLQIEEFSNEYYFSIHEFFFFSGSVVFWKFYHDKSCLN